MIGRRGWKEHGLPDYGIYHFSRREWARYLFLYLVLDEVISYLFFRSPLAFCVLLPGCIVFFRDRERLLREQRAQRMQNQFLTGMQLVSTSIQAGYAVENAFREAALELEKIYRPEDFIVREFWYLVHQLTLNRSVEALLMDLGRRSHVEDIRNFGEVFSITKRTGGDLMAVIQNTVSCIQQKQETRQEIDTSLEGKRMEQDMMSAIPLFILGYVRLTSPGQLDVMYETGVGMAVMAVCFVLYLLAYFWGRKIMRIQV